MRERVWPGADSEEGDDEQDNNGELADGHGLLQGIEEDNASGLEEQRGSEVHVAAE